jgi:hypothetical protein
MELTEVLNFIQECDNVDFHLMFDAVRERHNNRMLEK